MRSGREILLPHSHRHLHLAAHSLRLDHHTLILSLPLQQSASHSQALIESIPRTEDSETRSSRSFHTPKAQETRRSSLSKPRPLCYLGQPTFLSLARARCRLTSRLSPTNGPLLLTRSTLSWISGSRERTTACSARHPRLDAETWARPTSREARPHPSLSRVDVGDVLRGRLYLRTTAAFVCVRGESFPGLFGILGSTLCFAVLAHQPACRLPTFDSPDGSSL